MIVKYRRKSNKLEQLEIVNRRLIRPHENERKIDSDYLITNAGYQGEQSLDFYLSFLNDKEYYILHDIRMKSPYNNFYFQIDSLLITKTHIVILEVKNYQGSIIYNNFQNQLIQNYNGKTTSYNNPLAQIERQKQQLLWWMKNDYSNEIPKIYNFVVMTNPNFIIKTENNTEQKLAIIRLDNVLETLKQLEKINEKVIYSDKDVKRLCKQIQLCHTELKYNVFESFNISEKDLRCGVFCPKCKNHILSRQKALWKCSECEMKFKDLPVEAINDYQILFGKETNSKKIMEFLDINSTFTLNKLLESYGAIKVGQTKGLKYILNSKEKK